MANTQNNQPTAEEQQLNQLQDKLNNLKKQLAESQKNDAKEQAKTKEVYDAKEQAEAKRQEYLASVAEQENSYISKREQYYSNNPKMVIATEWESRLSDNGKELTNAGYDLINSRWQKKATSNDQINYANYPATSDKLAGGEDSDAYPMSEITDLVLVDSISYANAGGGWDAYAEPQGVPLPEQRSGFKESKEIAGAVKMEVHSILDKGFSNNSMTGNLFGLSVDDIGKAMSTTDEGSASVLKYNYGGYGDPANIKRNIFEESNDIYNHTQTLGNINKLASIISNT